MTRPSSAPSGRFKWLFLAIWTPLVLTADGLIGWMLVNQARTYGFAATEGVVTKSRLTTSRGSKGGTSYGLEVAYDYEVGGAKYTGTRYAYREDSSSGSTWRDIQKGLPVGKGVPVYYDPDDPTDAVLERGLAGMHLFMAWFLTPFNVIMVGVWMWRLTGTGQRLPPTTRPG